MKIKSFCFTTIFLAGVGVRGIFVGMAVTDVGIEAGGVTRVSCDATQEVRYRVKMMRKT
jgi:hypothetical protein